MTAPFRAVEGERVETRAPRFQLVAFGDIRPNLTRNYLVKGLVTRECLAVVWGPPKCGKSFWTFDLVMHVALGREYRGRRVTQGPVVYVACEGAEGFKARVEAWRQRHLAEDHEPPAFYLVPASLDLIGERDQLIGAIAVHLGTTRPAAVAIDTLNRSLAGSESKDEDMAAYIRAADAIRETFRCAVVIVHHCGIDASRPRGHTSLTGAADVQIAVKRDNSGNVTATVEWMKDGPEGDSVHSRLEAVEVGQDEDGDPITSCIVVESDAPAKSKARLTPRQRQALDVLHNALVDHGKPAPDGTHYPAGARVVPVDLWRDYLIKAGVIDTSGSNPRQDFKRLKGALADRGAIREWNGLLWAVKE